MREFRFRGVSDNGKPIQGTIYAPNKKAAMRRATALSERHRFKVQDIQERVTFRYKVRHPNGKVVEGEQKAFSKEELVNALQKMGVEVVRVEKPVMLFQRKPPSSELILFVRLAANLLKEKLPFDEVLNLLINDVTSKSLKQALRDLNNDLKGGMDARQAFMKQQHILGKFVAYMLGLASSSGNMAEIYEATARFLERKDEFKKSVKSALLTPMVTLVVLIAALVWYVWFIFPQTAGLFADFDIELPPLTAKTMAFSHWLDANYLWVLGLIFSLVTGAILWIRTPRGNFLLHKYLIRLPVIGPLLHKQNIEIFCRVFSVIYSGSGENIEVLKIAAEACGNKYIEHRVKTITIPLMVAKGMDLVKSMEAAEVFTPMTIARFRSGAETGNVRLSAQQMADYYEKETSMKMKVAVETIQTVVAIIISIGVTFLTLISSELALISPSSTDMMGL